MWSKLLIVGIGGFIGAVARYGLSGLAHTQLGSAFPYGTLAVNVLGCLLMGVLMHVSTERHILSSDARLLIMVGLLGSLTTFSTFGYETLEYLRDREPTLALLNIAANLILSLAAVWIGWIGSRAIWS